MKCPRCDSDNVNDAVFCANCGGIIPAGDGYKPPQTPEYQAPGNQAPGYQYPFHYDEPDPNDKKAVAGMVLGISSLPCCFFSIFFPATLAYIPLIICAVIGVVGIFMSAKGLKSQNRRGAAIAGLVCAIVGLVLTLFTIGLVAFGLYAMESGLYDEILNDMMFIK
jgi:Predicted membrane protein